MSEIIWLIIELIAVVIIFTIIPVILIILAGNLKYNEKAKKKIMLILSMIYNGVIGFICPLIFFCLMFLTEENYIIWIPSFIIILTILSLPLNIFMKRKSKINIFIYLLINIIIFILGILICICTFRSSFNL